MTRAILLASATGTTLKGRLATSALSHGGALALALTCRRTEVAPRTRRERNIGLPIFENPPSPLLADLHHPHQFLWSESGYGFRRMQGRRCSTAAPDKSCSPFHPPRRALSGSDAASGAKGHGSETLAYEPPEGHGPVGPRADDPRSARSRGGRDHVRLARHPEWLRYG